MNKIWVVVADSSKARFFEAESRIGALRELGVMEHRPARAKASELKSDGPGSALDGNGPGRHGMRNEVDPKEHESRVFARELANRLEVEGSRGTYNRLVIAAAPRFLGRLRGYLSSQVRQLVSEELSKDLVNVSADHVRRSLPIRL